MSLGADIGTHFELQNKDGVTAIACTVVSRYVVQISSFGDECTYVWVEGRDKVFRVCSPAIHL